VGPDVEAQEQEAGGSFDAVAVVFDSLEEVVAAAAAVEVGYEVEATLRSGVGRPSRSVEANVGCIGYQAQEMGPEEEQGQRCIVGDRFDIVAGACSFGSRVEVGSSLSGAGACCSGTEAWHKLRPYYGCKLLEVFQRWTMLS